MTEPPRLVPFAADLPAGVDAETWLRILAGEPGLLLMDRPGSGGAMVSYLAWDPQPGSPLDYIPPGIEGKAPAAFFGGWAGTLSYDLGRRFERLPAKAMDEGWPEWAGGIHSFALEVRGTGEGARTRLVGAHPPGEGDGSLRERAAMLTGFAHHALRSGATAREEGPALAGPIVAPVSRAAHEAAVARAVDAIHAGDLFQVNLARRLEGTLRVGPVELALRLRAENPAPRSAVHFLGDGRWVVSSSPELLVEVEPGGRAVTRPIKGTRRRTGDAAADNLSLRDLLMSAKDRAELAMIVDLQRNDLGRISVPGSVRVAEDRRVEVHPSVFHTVAAVQSRLLPGTTPAGLLRAVFPGGSITGAPKIRAMELIDELEPVRRGAYTGSTGWFGPDGRSHWNILIRTLCIEGDGVRFSVGGGIVADSDPRAEYDETVDKGRALARALGAELR